MNEKLAKSGRMITFNKIDDYNRFIGINAGNSTIHFVGGAEILI